MKNRQRSSFIRLLRKQEQWNAITDQGMSLNQTLANTVMELTATFAACAAVPRTCFRMSAAHHHVRLAWRA